MAQSPWREWRYPVEFALLIGVAFFLPLREAPKNLLWLLYVVTWLVARLRSREFGGRADAVELLLAGLFVTGALSAAFGGIQRGDGNEWWATGDILRYGLLLVCVLRAGYTTAQKLLLLAVLVASGALAELEAIWNWKIAASRKALELVSVGHVNHSAIYLAICLGLAAGLLAGLWRSLVPRERALLGAATLFFLTGLFLGGSRAAGAVGILIMLAAALAGARSAQLGRRAWAAVGIVIVVAALVGGTSALQRQIEWGAQNYSLAQRDLIWNRGLVAWREAPAFGVGMENYGHFTETDLQRWLARQGRAYVKEEYVGAPHAHSLYINTLVERGVVGLAALLAFLGMIARRLLRRRPRLNDGGAAVTLWFGGVSAWLVTVVIGFANTTLHHEHAMLAMLAFGLAFAPPGKPSR
jgi:O-antigen ligase